MRRKITLKQAFSDYAWRGLGVAMIGIFAGYALFGANGVLAWGDYSQRLEARTNELAQLEQERAVLQRRVDLVDPRSADPDMVDELIRKDLGLARPDEVIIPLN